MIIRIIFAQLLLSFLHCGVVHASPTCMDVDSHDDGEVRQVGQLVGSINTMSFSPDSRTLIIAADSRLHLYHFPEMTEIHQLDVGIKQILDIKFSPDGERLFVGGGDPGTRGVIIEYSWPAVVELNRSQLHRDVIWQLAFSQDGTWLVTGGQDHAVNVTNRETRKTTALSEHSGPVRGVVFLDETTFVTSSEDGSLRTWSIDTLNVAKILEHHIDAVHGMVLAAKNWNEQNQFDDTVFSFGADRTIRYWQPIRGRMVRFIRLPARPTSVVAMAEPMELLIGDTSGNLHWVDMRSAKIIRSIHVGSYWIESLCFSPVEQLVIVGTHKGAVLRVKVN
ncbi:MAG TPA: hypothetical protein PKD64_14310 [Pirellulaceae bacterium]|nr:hypothetical protein [Pirellulaceae bacterium]HMO93360.1 hypothetical protein [Pirellulaceae bacterium]HMP70131.1 hypothetical protein [Pirellulaceae bacterium]